MTESKENTHMNTEVEVKAYLIYWSSWGPAGGSNYMVSNKKPNLPDWKFSQPQIVFAMNYWGHLEDKVPNWVEEKLKSISEKHCKGLPLGDWSLD